MDAQNKNFWLPLDNAAKIYPAILSQEFTAVFRITAVLKGNIRIKILYKALCDLENRFPYYTWPHWRFINKISSKTGVKFAVLDYPIAPENTYIDTIEMALSTYNVLLKDHSPSQIIFMGDSAGGGLALALAQILKKKSCHNPTQ